MKRAITTILFDWAGVFCTAGEPFSHPGLQKETGLTVDEMGKMTQHLQKPYYTGTITARTFWEQVSNVLSVKNITQEELVRAYLSSYAVYPEMLSAAQYLKNKYKTAILSNLTEEMMRHIIANHNVPEYFGATFFSNQIGLVKPEKEAYEYALSHLGSTPQETLFIDDSPKNVDAAKKLGIDAFVFESFAQFKQELAKRKIEN